MALTQDEINDLRLDAGLPADTETVFDNDALNRLYERVSGAADSATRHEATLGLMFRQLLSNAAKFSDYMIATSSEKKSQVFDHLSKLYAMYRPALEEALGTSVDQIAFSGLRPLDRERDRPRGSSEGWDDHPARPPYDFF